MRTILTEAELKKGWEFHDKITNHEFRKSFDLTLAKDYGDLIYHAIVDNFSSWKGDVIDGKEVPRFHESIKKKRWVSWKKEAMVDYGIDVYSNPTIALLNESIHDFNGIRWRLESAVRNSWDTQILLSKFVETAELILMLLHKLLLGQLVTVISFPKDDNREGTYRNYEFVVNPILGGWTDPYYLKKDIYDEAKRPDWMK